MMQHPIIKDDQLMTKKGLKVQFYVIFTFYTLSVTNRARDSLAGPREEEEKEDFLFFLNN